jgi:hypothetical protein
VSRSSRFDIRQVPFSTRGSWLSLSPVTGLHETTDAIHLDSHVNGLRAVLRLEPVRDGAAIRVEWVADATCFAWRIDDDAVVEATFDGPDAVRLRGSGLALRAADPVGELTPFTGSYLFVDPVDGAAVFTSYETGRRYRIRPLAGSIDVVGAEALGRADRSVVLGSDGGEWEAEIRQTTGGPRGAHASFDELVAAKDSAFQEWLDRVAPWRDGSTPAAELAAYVLWSATVSAEGELTRETVLMSKHWMNRVWSWDHVFNALALAPGHPELALDQFLAPFDHQDETGAIPDSIGHSDVLWNFVKPPIHGWGFRRLRATLGRPMTGDELVEVHDRLAAWTRHWLDHRRAPGRALPYYEHGNDSGWDNATTFDGARVVESPDLAAYLVLQLETLCELGEELGRPVDEWMLERDRILDALVGDLWTAGGFVGVEAHSRRRTSGTSLLMLMPFVLGTRLTASQRDVMAARLADHLTPFGSTTEPPTSPSYDDDGYWRGPIWAPSTALLESGLRESGMGELADEISARFRRLCESSGFAENFSATTGDGLRDRAYTWTAAVYLTLCADAAHGPAGDRQ